MTYSVSYSNQSAKFIRGTDKILQSRLIKKIDDLQTDPFPKDIKTIEGSKEKMFRVRVGDHRILYDVGESSKTIGIIKIDKRSRVY